MKTTCLWIDLDGTLVAPLGFRARVFAFVVTLRRLMELGAKKVFRVARAIGREYRHPTSDTLPNRERAVGATALALGLSREESVAFLGDALERTFPSVGKYYGALPGAVDFVEWARSRYTLILATNPVWPLKYVHMRLQWAGISPEAFQWITHGEEFASVKPQRKYYQSVLDHVGLPPEQCLMVGNDSVRDWAATSVGVPVYWLRRGHRGSARVVKESPQGEKKPQIIQGGFDGLRKLLEDQSQTHENV